MHMTGARLFEGDLNTDGRVDLRDLHIWRKHRTDISPSIVAVPEPLSMSLALVGCSVLAIARKCSLAVSRKSSRQLHFRP
jgi:hypothetical protein